MSHDSRGALLKKGDRVLVEGVLTEDPSADGGYCNASVKFVTPDQRDKPPMDPPNNVFNTRMLTKVGAIMLLALIGSCSIGSDAEAARRRAGGRLRFRPVAVSNCPGGNCLVPAKPAAKPATKAPAFPQPVNAPPAP